MDIQSPSGQSKPGFEPTKIEVGKTYQLHHRRFGSATVKILSVKATTNDAWIDTEVVSGVFRGTNDNWFPGDRKTIRQSHCTISPTADFSDRAGKDGQA